MAESTKRRLLVEGQNDLFAITHLVNRRFADQRCTVSAARESVHVQQHGGIENLLKEGVIDGAAKTYERLGIVVDSDGDVQARWQQVAHRLEKAGVVVPDSAASGGVVVRGAKENSKVGVWLMPDNISPGALEIFLRALVNPGDPLWLVADVSTTNAENTERRFAEKDGMKARLHAWLAWQANPDAGIGPAIDRGFLDPMSPEADAFVGWFEQTFA
jgi:hypothetical protein